MTNKNLINFKAGEKVLVYGIGNVGRQDDGLGIRLVEKLEKIDFPANFSFEANYQLNAEDALLISEFDVVIFADASKRDTKPPFAVSVLEPSSDIAFSTHAMDMGSILGFCQKLYAKTPRTYLLAMPGKEWELSEEMTAEAKEYLERAYDYLLENFNARSFLS